MKITNTIFISVRESLIPISGQNTRNIYERFMISPLMNAIKIDEPMEALTELRQVAIVFVNIVVPKMASLELIEVVDSLFCRLSE